MNNEYKNDIEQVSLSVCEPMAQWGGKWTEEKLDAFEKYVNAYLLSDVPRLWSEI